MVEQKKSPQMSLDLGLPSLKSVDEIAFGFNKNCADIVANIKDWPGNIICLIGEDNSGAKVIFDQWQLENGALLVKSQSDIAKNAFLAVNLRENIDEGLLFALFQSAECDKARVLLFSSVTPENWLFALPDLLSRTKSVPVFQVRPISEAYFAQILSALIAQFGISTKKMNLKGVFQREICSFGLLSKIFSHISMLLIHYELPKEAGLKSILVDLANSEMNKDLFDDNIRS